MNISKHLNLGPPTGRVSGLSLSLCQPLFGWVRGYSVRKALRKGLFRTQRAKGLTQSQTGGVGQGCGVGGDRRDEQRSGDQRNRGNPRETAKLEAGVGGGQSGVGNPSVGHSLAFITGGRPTSDRQRRLANTETINT